MELLTNRDREYLRVLYVLNGMNDPIGPVELSKKLGVTKVCAFQKMHRLEALGYGKYVPRKGLKLNSKAFDVVKQDVKRHHILESFLFKKLELNHKQACIEAEKLDSSVSKFLFNKINSLLSNHNVTCCQYDSDKDPSVSDLKTCPWVKRLFSKEVRDDE